MTWMSSIYRAICLSHNPAIVIRDDGDEWHSGKNGRVAMEAALQDPSNSEALQGHAECELMGGEFSYPLVSVYCPPQRADGNHKHYPCHTCGEWIDIKWLRLMAYAYIEGRDWVPDTRFGCWSRSRLWRLRHELNLPDQLIVKWARSSA